ncbi:hypothetical protein MXD81_42205 [Microbacteriaceae bacterium K1510]|nr:hypothetical protein [Microbacteriaceae bacterium K1510]
MRVMEDAMVSRPVYVVVAAAALAVFLGAPADAASKVRKHKKPVVAYASERTTVHRGVDKFPVGPLYFNGGEYLGDDPDPFIRSQLWRDLGAHFGGDQ